MDVLSALEWNGYSVSRVDKEPLLAFVVKALRMRDCSIVYASEPNRAPFYIVFDTPSGERQGLLVYAFFANSRLTANRPRDEHRFQIKYGSKLKGILEVARSEEHTSELQSLMRISYAVFCLNKKKKQTNN